MKNKWKIAFWVCLILLITTGVTSLYSIIDQGVTITYTKDAYTDTEADLETLIEIIGQTDQTKVGVKKVLEEHRLNEYMDFKTDTISLERVLLIFENDTLKTVEKQW